MTSPSGETRPMTREQKRRLDELRLFARDMAKNMDLAGKSAPEVEAYCLTHLAAAQDYENEECARLFESINAASGAERLSKSPGADAMGAILEFRDAIRSRRIATRLEKTDGK